MNPFNSEIEQLEGRDTPSGFRIGGAILSLIRPEIASAPALGYTSSGHPAPYIDSSHSSGWTVPQWLGSLFSGLTRAEVAHAPDAGTDGHGHTVPIDVHHR